MNLDNQVSLKKKEKENIEAKCSLLISQIDEAEHEKELSQRELDSYTEKINSLQKKLSNMGESSAEKLFQKIEKNRLQIQSLQREVFSTQEKISFKEQELDNIISTLNQNFDKGIILMMN